MRENIDLKELINVYRKAVRQTTRHEENLLRGEDFTTLLDNEVAARNTLLEHFEWMESRIVWLVNEVAQSADRNKRLIRERDQACVTGTKFFAELNEAKKEIENLKQIIGDGV